jgi:hypothetical protein
MNRDQRIVDEDPAHLPVAMYSFSSRWPGVVDLPFTEGHWKSDIS